MGSTSCLLISGSYSCCAAVKALAHTATWWTHRETSSGTTLLANPSCTHTYIYIFVQIDILNEASELKGSHGRGFWLSSICEGMFRSSPLDFVLNHKTLLVGEIWTSPISGRIPWVSSQPWLVSNFCWEVEGTIAISYPPVILQRALENPLNLVEVRFTLRKKGEVCCCQYWRVSGFIFNCPWCQLSNEND